MTCVYKDESFFLVKMQMISKAMWSQIVFNDSNLLSNSSLLIKTLVLVMTNNYTFKWQLIIYSFNHRVFFSYLFGTKIYMQNIYHQLLLMTLVSSNWPVIYNGPLSSKLSFFYIIITHIWYST